MKKEKTKKPHRPAKQAERSSKRVDPDMFNSNAPPQAQNVPQRAPQKVASKAKNKASNKTQQSAPNNTPQQGRPITGTNPRVFDQAMQPILRQQQKKHGMQQTILPMGSAAPPPIDDYNDGQASKKRKRKPQQAEKRLTRGEARRRRFKKKLLTFIILTLVIVAGVALSITFLFKIESFVVDGTSTYSQQDLETAFGIAQGENIFSFNISTAESKMSAALPYAETVTVRRRLPSTIVFKTTEAIESYYTENPDGGYVVLSGQLKVLRLTPEPPQDLPFLTGAEALLPKAGKMLESGAEGKLDSIKATLAAIESEGLVPVSTLDVTNILEISFVYDNRAKVILGTANDLEDKLALAGVILRNNIGQYEKGTLDVSNKTANKDRQGIWSPGTF